MVLTARISDTNAGEDKTADDAFGTDNVLLFVLAIVKSTSGVEIVVAGDDEDAGRTKDLIFSFRQILKIKKRRFKIKIKL
jgi:hypothetical protein